MYKFIDRDGSTLVLRPDITPSIARAVAKYFKDEKIPLRFSYCGNTFINKFRPAGEDEGDDPDRRGAGHGPGVSREMQR